MTKEGRPPPFHPSPFPAEAKPFKRQTATIASAPETTEPTTSVATAPESAEQGFEPESGDDNDQLFDVFGQLVDYAGFLVARCVVTKYWRRRYLG